MSTAAERLSQWLESTHPDLFDALFRHVQNRRMSAQLRTTRLRGFGQDDEFIDIPDTAIDFSPSMVDIPTLDVSDLQTPNISAAIDSAPDITSALDVSTDNSGTGFLQSIGSGITSAASSVANFLTSSQGLSDLTKLGTAFFQVQNTKANAQLQSQVLQAQIARAGSGQSPSPISYAMVNGQLVPVYSSAALPVTATGALIAPSTMPSGLLSAISSGQSQLVTLPNGSTGYVVPSNAVGSLTGGASLQQLFPWLLLVGAALVMISRGKS
jgi:hypothetical protein